LLLNVLNHPRVYGICSNENDPPYSVCVFSSYFPLKHLAAQAYVGAIHFSFRRNYVPWVDLFSPCIAIITSNARSCQISPVKLVDWGWTSCWLPACSMMLRMRCWAKVMCPDPDFTLMSAVRDRTQESPTVAPFDEQFASLDDLQILGVDGATSGETVRRRNLLRSTTRGPVGQLQCLPSVRLTSARKRK
jgi:hypothetical protein